MSLTLFLTTAFAMGLRHALDPDHLVAVSTLVAEERRIWAAARLGLFWGLGHLLPLLVLGLPVLLFGIRLPEHLEAAVDLGVGVMLIALGAITLWRLHRSRVHVHTHSHGREPHVHFHSHRQGEAHDHTPTERRPVGPGVRGRVTVLVGMIHGLAGSGPAAVLTLAVAPSQLSGVGYLLLFGVGSCAGMFLTTLFVAAPAVTAASRFRLLDGGIRLAASAASVAIGGLLWVENLPVLLGV